MLLIIAKLKVSLLRQSKFFKLNQEFVSDSFMNLERAVMDITSVIDYADQKGKSKPFPSLKLIIFVCTLTENHFCFRNSKYV